EPLRVCGLISTAWPSIHSARYSATVMVLRSMYSPRRALTRASSRAALASSSVAKPPTQRGRLSPVSGSFTRTTYDQVVPRFMTPSRSLGAFSLRGCSSGVPTRVLVTTAPSFSQAPLRCLVKGLGGSRGDGLVRSPLDGLYDTTAPGSREASDRQQGDAPQSAG